MKISVIIAVYNDPEIKRCLDSIRNSEDIDFEVIVVDDGSTTIDIEKITKDYPFCKTFVFEKNKGPAAARNYGVKHSSGDIVFFIDSDAQVYPDTLRKIIECFENDSSLDGVTIAWSDEPVRDNFFNKFKAIEFNHIYGKYYRRSFGSNGSAIYKKIFLSEGGFDESFKSAHAEDFHLGLRLFGKGYKIILNKKILMKNAYVDKFFFNGLKKYCKRAFLRAGVVYQTKDKIETTYNSKKFKLIFLLSILTMISLSSSVVFQGLAWLGLFAYLIFFLLNFRLYTLCLNKYGVVFFIKSMIIHFIYILSVSLSGIAGLVYAFYRSNFR